MLRVGLTGGIGSGKSTVANRLAEHGAVVVDADQLAREVVAPGSDGLAEIVRAFGEDVLRDDGSLDRPKLGELVFADPEHRATLNGIVHPRVGARTAELMAAAPPDAVVVHDVPLLVENGLAPAYHLVIVVDAPVDVRVRRLIADRGMSEQDARARIAAQADEVRRRAVADVWLDNSGAREVVLSEVDALWADRLTGYESNVRLHRRAAYGGPRIVEPDATWPAQAERLIARIRVAAGEKALRVDHIGSTSVAGLAAKDVIDLQVTVASMDDADALAGALDGAGFPRFASITGDEPKPAAPDPEQWVKRVHAGTDPGRPANVHLRVEGRAGWRFALLFRDWMRADADARAEYEALKRRLAKEFTGDDDAGRYAEAKEPWFDDAFERAEAWATTTNWHP
ncbi:dephospho-CoA kinase [Herbihabitans rhizosphaerae]|uniref:Dephospho-CoA kinase n=1 Tax=Herbihabitans rhizosphaerae TaxID=1872711 RepID=A0A4Q7KI05_9PSEU|nr:dephospho-CoA kinase [Herbihabitans rhizosphaerae]RZS34943.1 dephospho-CoA kinase [Herbihabitans rhizosphaerae]